MVWIYYPHLNRMIYNMAQVKYVILSWCFIAMNDNFHKVKGINWLFWRNIFNDAAKVRRKKKGYVIMHVIKCSVILIKPSSLSIILFCETELKYIKDNQLLWMFFMTR